SNTRDGSVSSAYTGVPGSYLATAAGFQVTVPAGTSPAFAVTVTGINDFVIDGPQAYTVMVSASGFAGLSIPKVGLTNNDHDTAGITLSRSSGLVTSAFGGTDTFTVSLNTQP